MSVSTKLRPVSYTHLDVYKRQDLAKDLAQQTEATVVPFSTQEKVDGAYLEDGVLYFRGEAVMRADQIGVPGSHNVENALATIAVAKLRGIDNQTIQETLSAFGGVKHRLQYVAEIEGVKFYNDSTVSYTHLVLAREGEGTPWSANHR